MLQQGALERVETAGPEVLVMGDPAVGLGERPRLDAAAVRAALDGAAEQPRRLQNLHMLGRGRERHVERLGQFSHRPLGTAETAQHGAASGIGQGLEYAIEILFNHVVEYKPARRVIQPLS